MSDKTPFDRSPEQTADVDLSSEIAQCIQRGSGERVTCRRIFGSNYRCNWWAPRPKSKYDNPRMEGLLVTTHVVMRSRFLTVNRTEHGLSISDPSEDAADRIGAEGEVD